MILQDISGDKHQRLGGVSCKVLKGKWGKSCYSTGQGTPTRTLTWSRWALEFLSVSSLMGPPGTCLRLQPQLSTKQVTATVSLTGTPHHSGFHQTVISFSREFQALGVILLCGVQGLRLLPPCCCVILGCGFVHRVDPVPEASQQGGAGGRMGTSLCFPLSVGPST